MSREGRTGFIPLSCLVPCERKADELIKKVVSGKCARIEKIKIDEGDYYA